MGKLPVCYAAYVKGTIQKTSKTNHVWSATLCTCLRKDCVRCHAKSTQHLGAVELEIHRVTAEMDGGIAEAFQTQIYLQKQAIKGAMQCLYSLVHLEIPTQPNMVV